MTVFLVVKPVHQTVRNILTFFDRVDRRTVIAELAGRQAESGAFLAQLFNELAAKAPGPGCIIQRHQTDGLEISC